MKNILPGSVVPGSLLLLPWPFSRYIEKNKQTKKRRSEQYNEEKEKKQRFTRKENKRSILLQAPGIISSLVKLCKM